MYRNGRCAIDAVPRDGFQNQQFPIEYDDRDHRHSNSHHHLSRNYSSVGIDAQTKHKNRRRRGLFNTALYSVAGRQRNLPQLRNSISLLGPVDGLWTDEEASRRVEWCFKKRQNHVPGRILWKLLNRQLALGHESLETIKVAMDNVFFDGKLRGKVRWRWSRAGEEAYENELLGSTTPRYSPGTGIEARIVLSRPLLLSGRYSHDLLLSTFLHELVHCYLFICCGDQAQKDGGHTPGFQHIVQLINGWIGNSRLRLCSMEADLDHFVIESEEISRCPSVIDGDFRPPCTSQYEGFSGCTFVCGSTQNTLLLGNLDPPAEFGRIQGSVSPPSLAYVSMQERMMLELGRSASMPIIVE